jgi:hypothetical protein
VQRAGQSRAPADAGRTRTRSVGNFKYRAPNPHQKLHARCDVRT